MQKKVTSNMAYQYLKLSPNILQMITAPKESQAGDILTSREKLFHNKRTTAAKVNYLNVAINQDRLSAVSLRCRESCFYEL